MEQLEAADKPSLGLRGNATPGRDTGTSTRLGAEGIGAPRDVPYERVTEVGQLGQHLVHHLTKFWFNYNALKNKIFNVLGVYGPDRAADALEQAAGGGLISESAEANLLASHGMPRVPHHLTTESKPMPGSTDREEVVRQRAFSLWEADGRPQGRDDEYWFRALQLLADEDDPAQPNMTQTPPL